MSMFGLDRAVMRASLRSPHAGASLSALRLFVPSRLPCASRAPFGDGRSLCVHCLILSPVAIAFFLHMLRLFFAALFTIALLLVCLYCTLSCSLNPSFLGVLGVGGGGYRRLCHSPPHTGRSRRIKSRMRRHLARVFALRSLLHFASLSSSSPFNPVPHAIILLALLLSPRYHASSSMCVFFWYRIIVLDSL